MNFRMGLMALFAAAGLMAAPSAFADDPIRDIVEQPVPTMKDGTRIPIGEVQRALLQALVRHKFDATAIAPGHITARFERRWSSFEVDILYTESSYSVRYRNSKRMDYDARRQSIDESYNEQLALLGAQAQSQFDVVLQRLNRVAQKRIRKSFKV
jgi:hypothetical protein